MRLKLLSGVKYAFAIALVVVSLALAYLITPIFGNKVLIVRSGSMTPTLPVGSLVVVRPKPEIISPLPIAPLYRPGNVISFEDSRSPKTVTTHRVVSYKIEEGRTLYETKGDANMESDKTLVTERHILGATFLTVPYLGQLFSFTKTAFGFLLLVLMPAIFVILMESWNILRELRKKKPIPYFYIKNFNGSVNQAFDSAQTLSQIERGPTLTGLLPLLAVGLIFTQTYSYFSDSASSTTNVFAASQTFTTNHLVINEVFYNPSSNFCGTEPSSEWVEIYNPTASNVNLNGWQIHDNTNSDSLPEVTLNAGSFAIIANCDQTTFETAFPLPSGTLFIDLNSPIGGGLANGGDEVRLTNSINDIDHISYGSNSAAGFSVGSVISSHSIERSPLGADTNTAADWVDRTLATPGS